jgi:hypothetical protein
MNGLTVAGAEGVYSCQFSLDDDYWLALYLGARHDEDTSKYSTASEAKGDGYTPGGKALCKPRIVRDGNCFVWDFDDLEWNPSSITADSAMIYNRTRGKSLAVFSVPHTVSKNGAWKLFMPAPNATEGVVRFYF